MGIKEIIDTYQKDIVYNNSCLVCINTKENYMPIALYRNADNELKIYFDLYHSLNVEDGIPYIDKNTQIDADDFKIIQLKDINYYINNNIKKSLEYSKSNKDSNYHIICDEINSDGGNIVCFNYDDWGLLICAVSTDEDYYWCYLKLNERNHLKVCFSSCVGGYDIITSDKLNGEMISLRERCQNDIQKTKQFIEDYFETHLTDVVFTEIKIKP